MKQSLIPATLLACFVALSDPAEARAQFPTSQYWNNDWQHGIPLWPPAYYWAPIPYPGTGFVCPFPGLCRRGYTIIEVPAVPAPKKEEQLPPPKPVGNQALLQIVVPEDIAQVYVDDKNTDTTGTTRYLATPQLERGKSYTYQLRAAFRRGDDLLIEDQKVTVQAGQTVKIEFRGTNALRVALPKEKLPATARLAR